LDIKYQSELHWKYNEGILERTLPEFMSKSEIIELCGYLYTQSMIHGYRHGEKGEWSS